MKKVEEEEAPKRKSTRVAPGEERLTPLPVQHNKELIETGATVNAHQDYNNKVRYNKGPPDEAEATTDANRHTTEEAEATVDAYKGPPEEGPDIENTLERGQTRYKRAPQEEARATVDNYKDPLKEGEPPDEPPNLKRATALDINKGIKEEPPDQNGHYQRPKAPLQSRDHVLEEKEEEERRVARAVDQLWGGLDLM